MSVAGLASQSGCLILPQAGRTGHEPNALQGVYLGNHGPRIISTKHNLFGT